MALQVTGEGEEAAAAAAVAAEHPRAAALEATYGTLTTGAGGAGGPGDAPTSLGECRRCPSLPFSSRGWVRVRAKVRVGVRVNPPLKRSPEFTYERCEASRKGHSTLKPDLLTLLLGIRLTPAPTPTFYVSLTPTL